MTQNKIYIIKKGAERQLTPHLNSRELDCSCDVCKHTPIDMSLAQCFEKLRRAICALLGRDTPLIIKSGHRCQAHNQEVEGASELSMHMVAAMDILCPEDVDVDLFAQLAKQSGFNFVLRYYDIPRIHVDNRSI